MLGETFDLTSMVPAYTQKKKNKQANKIKQKKKNQSNGLFSEVSYKSFLHIKTYSLNSSGREK